MANLSIDQPTPLHPGTRLIQIKVFEVVDNIGSNLIKVRCGNQSTETGEKWLREHTTPLSAEFAEVLKNAGWLK